MIVSAKGYRLYLATLETGDADAIVRNANDPEVLLNVPTMPSPYTMGHALQLIEFARAKLAMGDEFHMGIHLLDGRLIGLCVLANLDRRDGSAELGYWIGREHRGRGYAREALRLIMNLGFNRLGIGRIYAKVLVQNSRSSGLLESLSFKKAETKKEDILHNGVLTDEFVFGILKKDYIDAVEITVEYR